MNTFARSAKEPQTGPSGSHAVRRFLNSLSVRAQLFAGFGVVLALMILMSLVAFRQLGGVYGQAEALAGENLNQLILTGQLQDANQKIGIAVRDIVSLESLSAQKEATQDLKNARQEFQRALDDARKSVAEGEKAALLQKVADDYKALTPMIDEVMVMVDEANIDSAKTFVYDKLRPKQLALSSKMSELVKLEANAAKTRADTAQGVYRSATGVLATLVVVGLLVGGSMAWLVTGGIVKPLRRAAEIAADVARGDFTRRVRVDGDNEMAALQTALNHMSEQLAETVARIRQEANRTTEYAQQLSVDSESARERSQTQVDRVMAMTAAVEEMSVSIREVSNNAEGVSQAAGQAQHLSAEGSAKMAHNRQEIQEIVQLVDASEVIISELSSAITEVSAITKVIKEIADQTNLLALNAAIEAARAGEQGRGFAVVADEVRKLAERTTKSTAEIGNMLGAINGKAADTVAAMQKVKTAVESGARDTRAIDDTLRQIVDAANEVSSLVSGIATATQEQARSTETTAQGIETISVLTEETNGTIQRVKDTAADMNQVSHALQELVGKFRINA